MSTRLFYKNRLKFGNDFTDFAPDIEQVIKAEGSFRASERYRDGNIAVHVHLRIRPSVSEDNATEYCAIFSKQGTLFEPNVTKHSVTRFIQDGETWPFVRQTARKLDKTGCRMQKPVLISIIDPTQSGEGMVESFVTSDVWLTPLNQCLIALKQSSEGLSRTPVPFVVVVGDDKGGFYSYLVSPLDDQGGNHVVQNYSKFVCPLSNEDTPFGGWFTRQAKNVLAALFIELTPDAVVYGLKEPVNFTVELAEILICPLEPKAERPDSTIHERSMLYSNYGRRKNGNAKDFKGLRDTNPRTQRRVRCARKGGETHQTSSSPPPPEEVKSRTVLSHRRGDYTAKHIHSGSLEDV